MKDKNHIPRHLEAPYRFIILTLDELAMFLIPLLVNLLFFGTILLGAVMGAGLTVLLRRAKGDQGSNYLWCFLYWHLPALYQLKSTPPSCARIYVG